MKILIIPEVTPFPLDNGGAVAQYAVLEYLQDKCDITVCCIANSAVDFQNIEKLRMKLLHVNFEIINLVEDNSLNIIQRVSSKRSFKKKIIKLLKYAYHKLDRVIKNPQLVSSYSIDMTDDFKNTFLINPAVIKSERYINQLVTILSQTHWDIVQVEFYEMLELVSLIPTSSKKIFVSHESRTLRFESSKKYSSSSEEFCNYILSVCTLYEMEMIKKYDSVIVFSDDDKIRLNSLGILDINVSAFPILSTDFVDVSPFQKLNQLVFIGGPLHTPNLEGLTWFVNEIYPAIYEKYKLPLVVIGRWDEIYKIKTEVGEIIYKGFVSALIDEIRDSVQIVPVRIGNGIRTKILLGMGMKMPIITSVLGVEGINVSDKKEIFLADTQEEYLEKIKYILDNELGIQKILENASNFVKTNYSQAVVGETRLSIYLKLLSQK